MTSQKKRLNYKLCVCVWVFVCIEKLKDLEENWVCECVSIGKVVLESV